MATLKDYYNTNDDYYSVVSNVLNSAQTFTASASYSLNSIKLKLFRTSTPGTVTVKLRATDGTGKPTGSALATATTNGDTLTTSSAGEWREITFGSPYNLTSGVKYAICLSAAASSVNWKKDQTSPTYTDGDGYFGILDTNWTIHSPANDFMFETYTDFSPPADIVTIKKLVVAAANKIYYEDI